MKKIQELETLPWISQKFTTLSIPIPIPIHPFHTSESIASLPSLYHFHNSLCSFHLERIPNRTRYHWRPRYDAWLTPIRPTPLMPEMKPNQYSTRYIKIIFLFFFSFILFFFHSDLRFEEDVYYFRFLVCLYVCLCVYFIEILIYTDIG